MTIVSYISRVKFIIEEIEREEAALREDLYSADRKFAEYYNVSEKANHNVLCTTKAPFPCCCMIFFSI